MPASPQSFANHAHRPVPTAIAFAFTFLALVAQVQLWAGRTGPWLYPALQVGILGALVTLVSISRLYTTKLQDRIIRLEMRVRAASLLSPAQQRLLDGLDMKRVAALRFASDEELGALVERAARESLKPADIKRAVTHWRADFDRT